MAVVNLTGSYNYGLVALSVLIAIFASYAALDLAGRVRAAGGWTRAVWLLGGASAMGIGIWSMHYIGMLAFILPVPVAYHWPTVLLSLFAAILASVVALYVVSRQKMGTFEALSGSVLMGAGIAGMHYIGMAAMRLPAVCHFNSFLVVLSVVFAVLISLAALWITFHFREEETGNPGRKIAGAVVMGAAIPVMHYTGMAAAQFKPSGMRVDLSHAVSISTLGTDGIAAVTLIVLGLALLTSALDRRFAAHALELHRSDERYRQLAKEKLQQSEAYLSEAQRLSHTGSFGWRVSTGETLWSQETFRIFQYDRTATPTVELVLQRVHPQDAALVKQTIERASQDGKDFEHEYRLMMPDGAVKHVHVVAHAERDKSGEIEFVGAVMDVSDRKRAEEELRRSEAAAEQHLRLVVDTTPAMINSCRPDGCLDYVNKGWLDYFGFSLETALDRADVMKMSPPSKTDIHGRNWQPIIHPEDLAAFRNQWKATLASGKPGEHEARVRRFDGVYRWHLFRAVPLYDETGKPLKWYASAFDIEDRKRAGEALRMAFEEIQKLKDQLYRENLALKEEIDQSSMFEEIVGSSEALRRVLVQVAKVAQSDSTVLILGETGTGKELIARAIHKRSNRSTAAFIRVNCAAIPPSLIASELFGHEKGAFTGALQRRMGRFESADGGTIFLDEVGELPAETQIALLRVLQEREFERVGGGRPISVDVRVLAATNRDLMAAVNAGAFRQDLFYRLNVFPIVMPPLRERLDDIPLLVEYLIERYAKKEGKNITNITKRTLDLFQAYDWPGNIRELQNVVERAIVLCEGNTFSVDETWLRYELPQEQRNPAVVERGLGRLDADREKEIIQAALTESKGRISGPGGAAAKLGIPRSTLESKIRTLGINKHLFKTQGA